MQTLAKLYFLASRQRTVICSLVASGLRRVWSIMRASSVSIPPAASMPMPALTRAAPVWTIVLTPSLLWMTQSPSLQIPSLQHDFPPELSWRIDSTSRSTSPGSIIPFDQVEKIPPLRFNIQLYEKETSKPFLYLRGHFLRFQTV